MTLKDSPIAREPGIAYLLHRFPHLTETFIVRELHGIRECDIGIEIFSLLNPRPGIVHEDVRELLPLAHYSAFLSKEVIGAQLYFIKKCPRRYLRAFLKAIRLSYQEPGLLIRTLLIFPKSVYFARQMQAMGIRHIHAHFAWLGGIAAAIIAHLLGITYTVHPHAFDLFTRKPEAVRMLLEDASQIVTISEYHRDYIVSICPQKTSDDIMVVHCGLDVAQFKTDRKVANNVEPLILSVGSLIEKKGHEYLIDACACLAERGIPFHCDIAGGGPRRRYELLQSRIIRNHLQERVTLLGPVRQDRLVEHYQRSDIFALPCVVAKSGDRDGVPVVLMEAMACELPVVTTAVAGIPELVEDGRTGLIVKERDVASLAAALEKLIVDDPLREKLGKQARQKVQADFNIQQSAAKLASVFQRLSSYPERQTEVQCE
ncbi:MAG: glycosyltransferase family 4 protein [Anaerolineae bacterium]|nr:glycosyltransferase family 4 protein [Anaerolineae bacterium]